MLTLGVNRRQSSQIARNIKSLSFLRHTSRITALFVPFSKKRRVLSFANDGTAIAMYLLSYIPYLFGFRQFVLRSMDTGCSPCLKSPNRRITTSEWKFSCHGRIIRGIFFGHHTLRGIKLSRGKRYDIRYIVCSRPIV